MFAHFSTKFLPTESRRRIGRLSRAYERLIEDILKVGVQEGEFRRDLDGRLASHYSVRFLNGIGTPPRASPIAASFRSS